MRGYVLLRSNPYMARTDADGRLEIKHLPTGRHVFQLWHERSGYLSALRIGTATSDSRGRLTVSLRSGTNKLPDIPIPPAAFAPGK